MTRVLISLLLLVVPLGADDASRIEARDDGPPPPGRLVDVGGWRMHIHCTGERKPGDPVVVLESGAGGISVDWVLVQADVSRSAQICSYDRSGTAWSELGPMPHTMRQIVYELRTLLDRAGVGPPYVLVGQSLGGRLIRLFTSTYPDTVAGMVMVDAGHDDNLLFINGQLRREWENATGKPVPPVKTSMPLRLEDIPDDAMRQIRAAASSASGTGPPYDKLPAAAREARRWALAQPGHYAANNSPHWGDETAAMRAERQSTGHPLGDRPLVVITRGQAITSGPRAAEREEERQAQQLDLARLSRNGRQVIASRSGHQIHVDEPEVVAEAIREVLAKSRR